MNEHLKPSKKIEEKGGGYHHHVSHFLLGSRLSEEYDVEQLQKSITALEFVSLQLDNNPEMKSKVNELHDKLGNIDINAPVDKELLNEIQDLLEKIKI